MPIFDRHLRGKIGVCVNPEDKARLEEAAKADRRTPSEIVRIAIEKELAVRGY